MPECKCNVKEVIIAWHIIVNIRIVAFMHYQNLNRQIDIHCKNMKQHPSKKVQYAKTTICNT